MQALVYVSHIPSGPAGHRTEPQYDSPNQSDGERGFVRHQRPLALDLEIRLTAP